MNLTRKTFFKVCSWFKINNSGLVLAMALKFYANMVKGLKLKFGILERLIPTFWEIMVENLVRRAFFPVHSRLLIAVNQLCCPNEKVSIATKNMIFLNGRFSKTRYALLHLKVWKSIAFYLKPMRFVSLQNNQRLPNKSKLHSFTWGRYWRLWYN